MGRFFAYSNRCGFEVLDTADDALAWAEAEIDEYRDEAGDGWSDEVDRVCWGEIRQETQQCDVRGRCRVEDCDDSTHYHGGEDYHCDYRLMPVAVCHCPESAAALIAALEADVERLQLIHVGASKMIIPVFDGLLRFMQDSVTADGPRMTEIRVRFDDMPDEDEQPMLLRLWASNGKGTPVDRCKELRRALDASNAVLATVRTEKAALHAENEDLRAALERHRSRDDMERVATEAIRQRDEARAEASALRARLLSLHAFVLERAEGVTTFALPESDDEVCAVLDMRLHGLYDMTAKQSAQVARVEAECSALARVARDDQGSIPADCWGLGIHNAVDAIRAALKGE